MRIISGSAKGKKLKAPSGLNTRPITDMIKEALFNVLGQRVPGSQMLDLFAGSGSVGIEALSRGASKAVFVDNSIEAIRVIKENLISCKFASNYEVHRSDVFKALGNFKRQEARFDLVYIDPPFPNEKIFGEIMKALDETDILEVDGIVVLRTPKKKEIPALERLHEYRLSHYGESDLHYYSKHREDPKA